MINFLVKYFIYTKILFKSSYNFLFRLIGYYRIHLPMIATRWTSMATSVIRLPKLLFRLKKM